MRALAAQRQRDAVRLRVVLCDDGSRIEIVGDQSLIDDGQRHGLGGGRKCLCGGSLVAQRLLERDVAVVTRPHLRRARFERLNGRHHVGQRLPLDDDRLGRVLGLRDRIRHHEGDGIAYMADLVRRQNGVRRHVDREPLRDRDTGKRAEISHIGAGQHEMHAACAACRRDIGDAKSRVGMR
jgi:hypothetical protein